MSALQQHIMKGVQDDIEEPDQARRLRTNMEQGRGETKIATTEVTNVLTRDLHSNCSAICKTILNNGTWGRKPTVKSSCEVVISEIHCEGLNIGDIVKTGLSLYLRDDFEGKLTIDDADTVIDRTLELCVQSMLVKERSEFTLKFQSVRKPIGIHSSKTFPVILTCTLQLMMVSNNLEMWKWNSSTIYEHAMHHKIQGVHLFKKGRHIDAFIRFSKGFKFLNTIDQNSNECVIEIDLLNGLCATLLNNMASCQVQFQNYKHAVTLCTKVLRIQPNNIKALYRRAVSYINTQEMDNAQSDLVKLLQIDPTNTAAKEKYSDLKKITKLEDAKYKTLLKRMFSN